MVHIYLWSCIDLSNPDETAREMHYRYEVDMRGAAAWGIAQPGGRAVRVRLDWTLLGCLMMPIAL
jgi:hypothetical protein